MVKIYLVTNIINEKKYVGITVNSIKRRWASHCSNLSQCTKLKNAIKKYGEHNFSIEEIFTVFNKIDASEYEKMFIERYNAMHPNGYNLIKSRYKEDISKETLQLLSIASKKNWQNEEYKQKMVKRDQEAWSEDRKDKYSIVTLNRWKETPEVYAKGLKALRQYTDNKKESIIGVNIENAEVKRYECINEAMRSGYCPSSSLNENCVYSNGHVWFYDEGMSDCHYIELAKKRLGGFGQYNKGAHSWEICDKAARIESMKLAAAHRREPLVAVSRFDGSILEFASISDAMRTGYTWGNIRQSLTKECKHAYNYVWFYKEKASEYYIQEALKVLGKFDNTNVKPFIGVNRDTGEELTFDKLEDLVETSFSKKEVRSVLLGKKKSHKNYIWKFVA